MEGDPLSVGSKCPRALPRDPLWWSGNHVGKSGANRPMPSAAGKNFGSANGADENVCQPVGGKRGRGTGGGG